MEDNSFNIKENMKASYGIVFSEGRGHVDHGPSYFDSIKSENGQSRTQLTISEYKQRHGERTTFMHRGKM